MPEQLSLDANRAAVLSMDYQTAIVSIYAKEPDLMRRAANVITRSRNFGMRIVHVQVAFRPNLPEISARNRLRAPGAPLPVRVLTVPITKEADVTWRRGWFDPCSPRSNIWPLSHDKNGDVIPILPN